MLNRIINNRFSNSFKELFAVGTDYPSYLYCDGTGEYVSDFKKTRRWFQVTADVTCVDKITYAKDYHKENFFAKKSILHDVNRVFDGERVFRWKHVMTIDKFEMFNVDTKLSRK